jgi:hypothetical protein
MEKKLKNTFPDSGDAQKRAFGALAATEGGELPFDEGLITGCKQHRLKKTLRWGADPAKYRC